MATCQCYRSQTAPATLCGKPAKGSATHNGRQYQLCGIHLKSCRFELLGKKNANNRRAAVSTGDRRWPAQRADAAPAVISSTPVPTPKRAERPSPAVSATAVPVGTEMTGNDGRLYIVRLRGDGTQYWAPCAQKTSGCRGNATRKNASSTTIATAPSPAIRQKVSSLAQKLNKIQYDPEVWMAEMDQRFIMTMADIAGDQPLWVLAPQLYQRLEPLDGIHSLNNIREYIYEYKGRAVTGGGADPWIVYRDGLVPELERLIKHFSK